MNPKILGAVLLAALAVAIILFVVVLPSPPPATPPTGTDAPAPSTAETPLASDLSDTVDTAAPPAPSLLPSSPVAATAAEEAWVENLDNLLGSEEDNAATTRKLIAGLRGLPADAQEEYVSHAVNLCEDEDFGLLEAVYLTSGTPPEVIEVIFDDALNRSDEVKLPMLAKTLRNPTHPMAGEAKEILEMYLDIDPDSTAPVAWEQEVQRYLREEAESQQ